MRGLVDDCTHPADPALGAQPYGGDLDICSNAAHGQARREKANYVRLEIRTDTLFSLIHNKSLVIEDLRGLDRKAKRCIRKLLLDTLRL